MPIHPDSLQLLEAVGRSLSEGVAPSLSGAERYEVLLAISAIGTVVREISDDKERQRNEKKNILALLKSAESPDKKTLATLEHELGRAIRADVFSDEESVQKLFDHLYSSCRSTLEITNPQVASGYTKLK